MKQELPIFSVSEISNFIKTSLEEALPLVKIVGEVSNFSHHIASGHLYFSLKDSNSLIKVVCFKQSAQKIDFKIEDGLKLTITGKISVFVKSSNYQIIATEVEKSGIGELAKIFEELKQKLTKEGLFDDIHKKKLPFLPNKIGLITAEGGAVLHDILKTLDARFPTKIMLYKGIMQGVNSAKSVISGIQYFNKYQNVDVIIIARGGGSFEDLFEFNNENLIREAFKSKIPIISAIGHETDFTLLDFVADKRAPTPTASVIFAVPSRQELEFKIKSIYSGVVQIITRFIAIKEQRLNEIQLRFRGAKGIFDDRFQKLARVMLQIKFDSLNCVTKEEKKLEKIISQISFFDIHEILTKGFGVVCKNGRKITSITDVKAGDIIEITIKDGSFEAIVKGETLL